MRPNCVLNGDWESILLQRTTFGLIRVAVTTALLQHALAASMRTFEHSSTTVPTPKPGTVKVRLSASLVTNDIVTLHYRMLRGKKNKGSPITQPESRALPQRPSYQSDPHNSLV